MCEHRRVGGKQLDTDCETLQLCEVLWLPCSGLISKLNLLLEAPASHHVALSPPFSSFLPHPSPCPPMPVSPFLTAMPKLLLAALAEQFLCLQFFPRLLPQGCQGSVTNMAVL